MLRQYMASLKKDLPDILSDKYSLEIEKKLEHCEIFRNASCLALYHALPDEVQTADLIEKWHSTKEILLPVVVGEECHLCPYEGKDSVLTGTYGILEPIHKQEKKTFGMDVIVVPGIAFDIHLNRLGRGKGYYDRLLASLPEDVFKIGICYDFQLLDEIPSTSFDVPMDMIITERRVISGERKK